MGHGAADEFLEEPFTRSARPDLLSVFPELNVGIRTKICPFDRIVREVKHDASDYKDIYKHLTHPEHPVDHFTSVMVNTKGDMIMVDENGLLKNPKKFFAWRGYEQPLAGRGLVIGSDRQGETVATTLTARYVMEHVAFLDNIRVGSFFFTTV